MDTNRLRLVVPMHLADTREQAIANVRYGLKQFIDYFNNNQPRFFLQRARTRSTGTSARRSASSAPLMTPSSESRRSRPSRGVRCDLAAGEQLGGLDQTKHSYELYARHVMPHFSGANRAVTTHTAG